MPQHTTQFGDTPTHLTPEPVFDEDGGYRYAVLIEEGQSVPRPASTKNLLRGPALLYVSGTRGWGDHAVWFDYPTDPENWHETTPMFLASFSDPEWVKANVSLSELRVNS